MTIPPIPYEFPLSSFQWPVALPTGDPDEEPLVHVCFAEEYLPLILGCLQQLTQPQTWQTTLQADLDLALNRVQNLIWMFQEDCPMIPPGTIVAYGGTSAPPEWLLCDGSAISRTDYAALFAAIGTNFGTGNGTTTFNLPDFRGRVVVGTGQGTGLTDRTIGDDFGEEQHQLSTGEMPSHTHTDSGHTHSEITSTATVINGGIEAPAASAIPGVSVTGTGFASLSTSGGNDSHNNMQPSLVATYLIKT